MQAPVTGPVSSGYGMRRHPVLGFSRFHRGLDFVAAYGTPIVAAADGVVSFAGWHGGHGQFVQIRHDGGLGTGYGHMARIVARPGTQVARGELIGYVGSTGLSTGPHLHYEVYRGGVPVDPATIRFTTTSRLAGRELAAFRATLRKLMSIRSAEAPQAARSPAGLPTG
jgi:murein DD-endopeptidase MepM/ murein hydrolase activator NlpD